MPLKGFCLLRAFLAIVTIICPLALSLSRVQVQTTLAHTHVASPPDDTLIAHLSAQASIAYLAQVMDQFHNRFPVYDDVSSAGNHFPTYTKIPDDAALVTLNGSFTDNPHSGATAIRCQFQTGGAGFGGFYFQNGILPIGASTPQPN